MRRRRSGSPRSARPTRCCPTRRSGASSISAGIRSATAAARPAAPATRSARSGSATSWTPSSAARAAAVAGAGPRSRVQPGADALIRMQLTLEECAGGVSRELAVDTAVLCSECSGYGLRARHPADHVRHLQRPRRGAERAALVPRPGRHLAAVPELPRLRRGHPRPVPAVRRRRPGAGPAQRRRCGSRPAWPTGCGCGWPARARSAPAAARPATCTWRSRRSRTSCSPGTAPTCTAPCSCR